MAQGPESLLRTDEHIIKSRAVISRRVTAQNLKVVELEVPTVWYVNSCETCEDCPAPWLFKR